MATEKPYSFTLSIEAEHEADLKAFLLRLRGALFESPGISGTVKKTVKEKFSHPDFEFAGFVGFGLDAPPKPLDTALEKAREQPAEEPEPDLGAFGRLLKRERDDDDEEDNA